MSHLFDRRTTAARADLASETLRGLVDAASFVAGEPRSVTAPLAPLRATPALDASLDTEALRGEAVTVFEDTQEGWAWVQLAGDGYVGYLPSAALGPPESPTHKVAALRTFVYPGPSLKLPATAALTLGSACRVERRIGDYAAIADGYVWAGHLVEVDSWADDFVAVAERFLGVPYLWGGKSSLGLDCSGLVQVALGAAGVKAPRDSDMQARDLGSEIDTREQLCRGDLVFWRGHVGIMRDAETLLHANGSTMVVTSEPLAKARSRIGAATGADISGLRRLPAPTA